MKTFDVSSEEARSLAFDMVATGEWGSDSEPAPILDWEFQVKQEWGEKLRWRSETERERFRLDQALCKHLKSPSLSDLAKDNDYDSFRAAVKKIALERRATTAEIESLKSVANPAWEFPGTDNLWKHRMLKIECLIALVAAGAGRDQFVLNRMESLDSDYLAEPMFDTSPAGLLVLVAMDDQRAVPALNSALKQANCWSIRLACLYGLPESRENGDYVLIEEFRKWIQQANDPSGSQSLQDWKAWKLFMSCLTVKGLVGICGQDQVRVKAPVTQSSPLIDWASKCGRDDWLMREAKWLRQRGLWGEVSPLRDHLLKRRVSDAVEFCMERVRTAGHDNNAHYDLDALLRQYPKPLPGEVLDVCCEVARLRCHPEHYKQRIEALRLLVDGVDSRNYPKGNVVELVLELAQSEPDPDVSLAAIDLVRWAAPGNVRQSLAGALVHESSRVREAALRAVSTLNP